MVNCTSSTLKLDDNAFIAPARNTVGDFLLKKVCGVEYGSELFTYIWPSYENGVYSEVYMSFKGARYIPTSKEYSIVVSSLTAGIHPDSLVNSNQAFTTMRFSCDLNQVIISNSLKNHKVNERSNNFGEKIIYPFSRYPVAKRLCSPSRLQEVRLRSGNTGNERVDECMVSGFKPGSKAFSKCIAK